MIIIFIEMRLAGGRSSWKKSSWEPLDGMAGILVHYWQPNHPNKRFRSNFNRTLFLVQIGEHFVPVGENGIKEYNSIGTDECFCNFAPTLDLEATTEIENTSESKTECENTTKVEIDDKSSEENKND